LGGHNLYPLALHIKVPYKLGLFTNKMTISPDEILCRLEEQLQYHCCFQAQPEQQSQERMQHPYIHASTKQPSFNPLSIMADLALLLPLKYDPRLSGNISTTNSSQVKSFPLLQYHQHAYTGYILDKQAVPVPSFLQDATSTNTIPLRQDTMMVPTNGHIHTTDFESSRLPPSTILNPFTMASGYGVNGTVSNKYAITSNLANTNSPIGVPTKPKSCPSRKTHRLMQKTIRKHSIQAKGANARVQHNPKKQRHTPSSHMKLASPSSSSNSLTLSATDCCHDNDSLILHHHQQQQPLSYTV
jgi:hypothetical protein